MCMSSSPKAPPVQVVPSPESSTPQESDQSVQDARDKARTKRLAAADANTTLVTGGAGLTQQASVGLKSAFGA